MLEIENDRLGVHGTEHSECKHLTTLDFKWLNERTATNVVNGIL